VSSNDAPVAIITQANDYVGPALARLMGRSGFRLVLHGTSDQLIESLRAEGVEVSTATGDLTTAEGNRALVESALEQYGRIDAACYVTGVIVPATFLETTSEQWQFLQRVNVDAVFHSLQAVLPPMAEAGTGQVVVFTSAAGARNLRGAAAYSATRAGANAVVRAAAQDVADRGVCVNAIGTNFMDFRGFLRASGADDPKVRLEVEKRVPLRRLGTMEELAEFAAVLLDGRSRFQTGQFFSYSGGWST
jgi:NAD(P)-dependent dehydrogenase (short-subunit alcohol dehydrogenase family)